MSDQPDDQCASPVPGVTPEAKTAEKCPQGRTDYEACFAPFRYCPVKGCGHMEDAATKAIEDPFLDGLIAAREIIERQTDLTELVHFERPSDYRKGVLTCLVAVNAAIEERARV